MLLPSTYSIRSGKYLFKSKGLTSYWTLGERDIVDDVLQIIKGWQVLIHTNLHSFQNMWQHSHSSCLRIIKLEFLTPST